MSRAKRNQIKARKAKENKEREIKLTFDDEKVSEKAAIIAALLNESEETKNTVLSVSNEGISVIRLPKDILTNIFEVIVPNGLPEMSEDVQNCPTPSPRR